MKTWNYCLGLLSLACTNALAANTAPIGAIESISGGVARGWACDPDEPTRSITVHFYADNTYQHGSVIGGATANLPSESAINTACKGGTNHRFEYTFQRPNKSLIGPGNHPVYAYGLDTLGGPNPLLSGSPRTLTVTGTKTPVHAAPNINTACRYYMDQNWNRIQPALGNCSGLAAWNIRGTSEDANFSDGRYFLPNDATLDMTPYASAKRPYWFYEFHPKGNGSYQVGWVIDKVNYPQDLSRYTGGFLNDVNFAPSAVLGNNLFMDIRAGVFANEQWNDSTAGLSRNRLTVGITTTWANNPGVFLEINLFKTSNFDLCTQTQNFGGWDPGVNCDLNGIYDRRSDYGSGEIVYYDVAAMSKVAGYPQTALVPGGGMQSFTLPLSQLFKRYAWKRPPADWSTVNINGLYIGHEVWGKGRLWTEFENYQVYSFVAD